MTESLHHREVVPLTAPELAEVIALARAKALACGALILAVNKNNEAAITAYRRFGFVLRAESKVDIGAGFVVDDFIMARSLCLRPRPAFA